MSEKHEHRWVAQAKVGARWSRCCGGWGSCGVVEEVTQGEWEALVGEEKKRAEAEGWRALKEGLPTSEERVVRAMAAMIAVERVRPEGTCCVEWEREVEPYHSRNCELMKRYEERLVKVGLEALKGPSS